MIKSQRNYVVMDTMKKARSDSSDSSNASERLLKDIYGSGAPAVAEGNHSSNGPKYYRSDLLEKGMFTLDPFKRVVKRANVTGADLSANVSNGALLELASSELTTPPRQRIKRVIPHDARKVSRETYQPQER